MSVARDRLLSLIEFCHHSERLKAKPAATVAAHGLFALYEHEIQGLPGIRVNVNGRDGEDEIWLAVERLHERKPPDVASPVLRPWAQITQSPTDEPRLRESTDGASLIEAGTHSSPSAAPTQGKPVIAPEQTVMLSEYDQSTLVHAAFAVYRDTRWRPWAEEEKRRRKTIRLYSQLFTLKQRFEGGIIEAQLELLWGVGLGIWNFSGTTVTYPLVGRPAELSFNPDTAEAEIRPRDIDARLEVDWYASVDNPGVAHLEKVANEFFGTATATFSPFDRATFEPLLRTAVTDLCENAIYWPNEVSDGDRTLPKPDNRLKITDTWVLMARPRTSSLYLSDLEKFRQRAEEADAYPPAVNAVVTEPATTNPVVELPAFRGVSVPYHMENRRGGEKARDVYFPKPFNDEQFRIVQLLDAFDGVVVQGPPGTGKTHTIANIVCHYLAEGKRVLVTSMKDPALREVQDKLPDEIRPLAISLLISEQEGMKQFEHAIHKIASEVQSLDRSSTSRAIANLEEYIDSLHAKLARIDSEIGTWAKRNLSKIRLETEEIDPQDAAREVVRNSGEFEWMPDRLGVSSEFAPQFSDADVVRIRSARRSLGTDIDYLGASLPQVAEFPDSIELLRVHQDLTQLETLKQAVVSGGVPALADSTQETLALAEELLTEIADFRHLQSEILQAQRSWTLAMRERLGRDRNDQLLSILEALGAELETVVDQHKLFLQKPVTTPSEVELDIELVQAVSNLAEHKSPFGFKGLFGRTAQKQCLESIRVLGRPPTDVNDWAHVSRHLAHLKCLRELASRWNAVACELQLDVVAADPQGGLIAGEQYSLYLKVKRLVKSGREISRATSHIFPNWAHHSATTDAADRILDIENAVRHHLTKDRLANVWAQRERFKKVLEGRTGRVIEDIRRFYAETLGNPEIDDVSMQAEWTALMAELSRVLAMRTHFDTLHEVCGKIAASGAIKLAALLKRPLTATVDDVLQDNWQTAWRLKRLATHLESIDAQEELKRLAADRRQVEGDLSSTYRDVVVKRTWLRLAENASPSIRAALQAYLNAIQKIGKGTGKRAVRYRQDARMAAAQANPAVPCWIMPHYRVSESLPAELGCFHLVIIDEASQSDLTALPSLLRAQKVLIVGDDKQVSPEGVGLEEEKVKSLMRRFLGNQVDTYRPQMAPDRSIYDLFKVVFARSTVMLKEHFRCVGPIIEYSKREFYNHELRPLRLPKSSERLDPPLIDVLVQDGYRKGDVNLPEARFIVDEIKAIACDPRMNRRSIGVVSLLSDKQALLTWEWLSDEVGPEVMQRHQIACGDARTFQGKERDIMFLSMLSAPNNVGAPLSRDIFAQRFNVAASRARDRMYLVRSVEIEHLSPADRLRRSLIGHFATPFVQDERRVNDLRALCESPFEREVYDELTRRGYRVTPQVRVGQYRIDLVIEGHNDARLAVECDGDKYHGADKWADDMQRQRVLERAGWVFWRCFASAFVRRRNDVVEDLLKTLDGRGIEAIGAEGAPQSVHTEQRLVCASIQPMAKQEEQFEPQPKLPIEEPADNAICEVKTPDLKTPVVRLPVRAMQQSAAFDRTEGKSDSRCPGEATPGQAVRRFTQAHRLSTALVTNTAREDHGGSDCEMNTISDSEIRQAILSAVRSMPSEEELLAVVRQALGFEANSESINRRITSVLNDELRAKRICQSSDLRFF